MCRGRWYGHCCVGVVTQTQLRESVLSWTPQGLCHPLVDLTSLVRLAWENAGMVRCIKQEGAPSG